MDTQHAADLAAELMTRHGLVGWTFAFDRAKVRAGACHFGPRRITLSAAITAVHDEEQVRETVLHEIAHALVGPGHGHDGVWRRRAVAIGATGRRCYGADEPAVPGRWQGRCAAGHLVQRHRRPTRVLVCTRCRGPQLLDRVIAWARDGRPVPPEELGPQVNRVMAQLRRQAGARSRP